MNNTLRGIVQFQTGDGRPGFSPVSTWTMKFSTNAICELEEALGAGVEQLGSIMQDPTKGRMKMLRLVIKCALSDHHPELTLSDVGELIDEVGMMQASELMQKALVAAMPPAKGGSGNPPKGAATAKRTSRRS